ASLLEIGRGLATWPQLAGDVGVGAGTVAEAIRRIALGEHLPSGRTRIDVAAALRTLDDPLTRPSSDSPEDHAAESAEPQFMTVSEGSKGSPLRAVVKLGDGDHQNLSRLYESMLARETNRHRGTAARLDDVVIARLMAAASDEAARLQVLTATEDIEACARILG